MTAIFYKHLARLLAATGLACALVATPAQAQSEASAALSCARGVGGGHGLGRRGSVRRGAGAAGCPVGRGCSAHRENGRWPPRPARCTCSNGLRMVHRSVSKSRARCGRIGPWCWHGGGVQRDRHGRRAVGGGRGAGLCTQCTGPGPCCTTNVSKEPHDAVSRHVAAHCAGGFLYRSRRRWPLHRPTPGALVRRTNPRRSSSRAACSWRSRRLPRWMPNLPAAAPGGGAGPCGQDLGKYGLRYSHLGWAYRTAKALARGTQAQRLWHGRGASVPPGLGEFFLDDLWRYEVVGPYPPRGAAAPAARAAGQRARPRIAAPALQHGGYVWGANTSSPTSGRWRPWPSPWSPPACVRAIRRRPGCSSKAMNPACSRLVPSRGWVGAWAQPTSPLTTTRMTSSFADRIETVTVDSVLACSWRAPGWPPPPLHCALKIRQKWPLAPCGQAP